MKVSVLVALVCTLTFSLPGFAAEDWLIEYGPKRLMNDPRYAGVCLKADLPKDLSYLSSKPEPRPPYKKSETGGSADPRYLLFTPNLGDPPQDKERAEMINLNSVVLSDYGVLAFLPKLREAWIVTDKPEQLPQALLDALGTDRSLKCLCIRGDVSSLDLAVLGRVPGLETIYFSDSHLTARNIEQLAAIKSLHCIEVSDEHELSAASVASLVAIKRLRDLRLSCPLAADADLSLLKDLSQLRRLHIPVRANTLEQVSKLIKLKVLKAGGGASDTSIEAGIPHLSTLKNLISLELLEGSYVHITGETLGDLRYLPLKYLVVNSCHITPDGYRSLSDIKSLRGLDITWTRPPHTGLMAVSNLRNLRRLDASCIDDYDQLKVLADTLPQCSIQASKNCNR
ncbi:MAG: hypothetical protein JST89_20980 [Cyanobacteria bacterium SZAS-4]|nr:hypothetical protein [Cyanobacteria bacterium SZAS-4]